MLLFRCKMEKVMHYLFLTFVLLLFLHLFLFTIINKNNYIVIINIVIIKKRSGGKDAILHWNLQKTNSISQN